MKADDLLGRKVIVTYPNGKKSKPMTIGGIFSYNIIGKNDVIHLDFKETCEDYLGTLQNLTFVG